MKYKSLIGNREVRIPDIETTAVYEINIYETNITIYTDKALKDAIKFGLIEEVRPKEYWIIDYPDKTVALFRSKEDAEKNREEFGRIIKFVEVIE